MKTKSKKIAILSIVTVLVLATVVGVGFAAWLIVSPASFDGAMEKGFVSQPLNDLTFTATAACTDEISFGAPADMTSVTWLSYEGATEQLVANITITLELNEATFGDDVTVAKILSGKNIRVAVKYLGKLEDGGYINTSKYANCITAGYLAVPSFTKVNNDETDKGTNPATWDNDNLYIDLTAADFTANANTNVATATVTVVFNWGSKGNPFTYYNDKDYTPALRDEAKALIGAVEELSEASYGIVLSSVAAD